MRLVNMGYLVILTVVGSLDRPFSNCIIEYVICSAGASPYAHPGVALIKNYSKFALKLFCRWKAVDENKLFF